MGHCVDRQQETRGPMSGQLADYLLESLLSAKVRLFLDNLVTYLFT